MIDSVRKYYPTVLIVIADDNEHPQPVTGPHIDQYIMPFGKVHTLCLKWVLYVAFNFCASGSSEMSVPSAWLGLVCGEKPGRLAGDHQVCAVG